MINGKQKWILTAGGLAIILMGVFPPWTYVFAQPGKALSAGYALISNPPQVPDKALTISEFKEKYPAYKSVPDEKLAHALHDKYYSSMPIDKFMSKVMRHESPKERAAIGAISTRVDVTILFIQWFVVITATIVGVLLASGEKGT